MLRACAAIEQIGIPAVALIGADFEPMARAIAGSMGVPDQAIAVYPGPGIIMTDPPDTFREKVMTAMVPAVIEALDARPAPSSPAAAASESEDGVVVAEQVVFSGDFDVVQEHFLDRGWSDGLPIVPPTVERVRRFLEHTARDPGEVLGVLYPERREATVWNVAVNGVMAGCRPEYLSVLLAIVEAIADPAFHLQDAGSTPGWEPLITVSGPVVDQLGFNYKQGAMRVGRQANTSIGRFLRLSMRNLAGLRIPPGVTDGAAIGYPFNVAMAESNWAADLVGWKTTREEMGYGREDNIVFLQSMRSLTPPIYSMGSTPDEHLEAIAEAAYGTGSASVHRAYTSGKQYPLMMMNPAVAEVFAKAGVGREYIRDYLARNCWVPLRVIDNWAERVGRSPNALLPVEGAAKMGIEPQDRNGEPAVPLFPFPENIVIVVGGNPGRNQSRMYFDNAPQGSRVIRRIEL